MGMISNIVCKTAGAAGMSVVLYDAYSVGKKQSVRSAISTSADTYESIVSDTRTTSTSNPSTGAIQNRIANMRMNNPIISIFGRIKGFCLGTLNSVTDNFVPVICSSMALACKGTMSKLGAWGLAGYAALTILKEGFGIGKENPNN